jgi:hypothetical protein
VFDTADHAKAALEKIAAEPILGPHGRQIANYWHDDKSQRGTPSSTLFFGRLLPNINPADIEAKVSQYSGFVSFAQREKNGTQILIAIFPVA